MWYWKYRTLASNVYYICMNRFRVILPNILIKTIFLCLVFDLGLLGSSWPQVCRKTRERSKAKWEINSKTIRTLPVILCSQLGPYTNTDLLKFMYCIQRFVHHWNLLLTECVQIERMYRLYTIQFKTGISQFLLFSVISLTVIYLYISSKHLTI